MTVKSKELCEQNLEKLVSIWPEAPAGVHSASVGRKDIGHDILYTTIGSVYKKAHLLGRVDLILIDECHLVDTKGAGMYRQLISDLQKYCPHVRVIGVTATPFRGDGVWITAGDDPLFTGIASKIKITELLEMGFLSPLVSAGQMQNVTTSDGISVVNGDYNIKQLAERVDKAELVDATCRELVKIGSGRKSWIVFGVTIEHVQHITDKLNELGIKSNMVSAETPKSEREQIIYDFKSGRYRALVNCTALGTGFDAAEIDLIALMRNTKSPVLYLQMMGRGLRIAPGKTDCMVADFTDTCATLGPIDLITGRGPKRKMTSERPVKLCEECGSINAVSARQCIDCGAPFDIVEQAPHGSKVSAAAIMSGQKSAVVKYTISNVTYAKHQKPGKPPSLRVEYWSGLRIVAKEWIGIESDNHFAASRASHWWWSRSGASTPTTVDHAIKSTDALRSPSVVYVIESGKYPEITGFEWGKIDEPQAA